jgi:SAM-dependent methyltransferase
VITRTTCRVCDGSLAPILSLGNHYVSNFLAPNEAPGAQAPLDLVLCDRCRLLQLKHTVPPETMYRNYWYRSGTNSTMREALADIAHKAELLIHLRPGAAVLDIGCNDGTLLAAYRTPSIYKIGFDPAQNLAQHSRKVSDHVVTGFFDGDVFFADETLRRHRPRVITSIAMFYDLEDPNRFVSDIAAVLDPEGLWVVQMSYLPLMLGQNAFDNICHEHLEYYSLQSFEYLLDRHDFDVVDVELNDVNGGSFRAYIRPRGADPTTFGDETYRRLATERVCALRRQERTLGLDRPAPYLDFSMWVERIKQDVVGFVRQETDRGKTVHVYGASTKGNTLLQYFGLDGTLIAAAAERNPDKWGTVTVGTQIPIISEEDSRRARPDYFLVLPWHFLREFQQRERDFFRGGGKFIVPVPHFTLI